MPKRATPDPSRLDRIVAEARRHTDEREATYRERAIKLFPWVCGRCAREFSGARLRELTVHHKDHNYDNNPMDGSNWELLCVYCHENEHARLLDEAVRGLEKILKEQELESSIPASDSADSSLAEISRDARISREVLVRELILLANTDARMALQKADLDAAHAKQIQSIYQARSWKITAALRWAYSSFRALQSKIRNKHP